MKFQLKNFRNKVKFESLLPGDVFMVRGEVFIKTDLYEEDTTQVFSFRVNAVNIENGDLMYFTEEHFVFEMKGQFVEEFGE